MSGSVPIRSARDGGSVRQAATGGTVDLLRAVLRANVELGQAQVLAAGAVADSLLSTAGQMAVVARRPMIEAAQELNRIAPVGLAALPGRARRGGSRRPWMAQGELSDADDVERPRVWEAETTTSYQYSIDLPGVAAADDVLVEVDDASIGVAARRAARGAEPPSRYETSIWVPGDADLRTVDAELEHGVLHIEVARREPTRGRQVKVAAGSDKPAKESHLESETKP